MAEVENESLFEAPPMGEQERMVEAILFATAEPVTVRGNGMDQVRTQAYDTGASGDVCCH